MKACPFCAEQIQDAAVVCRFCGRDLAASPTPEPAVSVTPAPTPKATVTPPAKKSTWPAWAGGVGVLLMLASEDTVGVGVLLLWVALAALLKGGAVFRWGGGFVAASVIGAVIMAATGRATPTPAATSPTAAAPKAAPKTAAAQTASSVQDDAACRANLQCWGEKHMASASVRCRPVVERLAKNNFEWTDGWLEPKFSHYRWKDQATGEVTFIGDKIRFQNGFGAWIYHVYECDLDATGQRVTDVRAQPGRLLN